MRLFLLLPSLVACVAPGAPGLVCGPGTTDVDGVCHASERTDADADAEPPCLADEVRRNGACGAPTDDLARLPFAAGRTVRLGQGYHGLLSHVGAGAYAVDFPVAEGTEVRAARPGRVLAVRDDSDQGCPDPSCADLANKVVIDHGDGTFGAYLHLAHGSAAVAEGEVVAQGQLVGSSGNTGFSTGPHLHFEVRDILGQSQPLVFAELLDLTGGTPFTGDLVSGNVEQPPPPDAPWSTCPTDLFAFLGVMLDPGQSCSHVSGTTPLRGHLVVEDAVAVVQLFDGQDYRTLCAAPDDEGVFEIDLPWDALGYHGSTLLAVTAGDPETCQPVRGVSTGAHLEVR